MCVVLTVVVLRMKLMIVIIMMIIVMRDFEQFWVRGVITTWGAGFSLEGCELRVSGAACRVDKFWFSYEFPNAPLYYPLLPPPPR